MASVIQQGISEQYDIVRGMKLYDVTGDLPDRARQLFRIIEPELLDISREYWRRYRLSPEVRETIARPGHGLDSRRQHRPTDCKNLTWSAEGDVVAVDAATEISGRVDP